MSGWRAYLDWSAAPPLDPRVRTAMAPFFAEEFASPNAVHEWARRPAEAIATAREHVAALIGAAPSAIIFTAGATESRWLAVTGLASAARELGAGVVVSRIEHPATLAAARRISDAVVEVGVDGDGRIAPAALGAAIADETALVSVVHGQPDIGTVQDVAALIAAARAARPGVRIHIDAAETVGRLPVDVRALDCDALTIGGPALGAPPWAGALYVREGCPIEPLIGGGPQEDGRRAGAQAVPAIVALGEAARIARDELPVRARRLAALGERLIARLTAVPGVRLNGPRTDRVPGHVQVAVGDVEGETLTAALAIRGVAASPGSACSGNSADVLVAIGLEPPWTYSAVLFTCGPTTTDAEVDHAAAAFAESVARLRAISPLATLN